jgi:hypothetical protein
MSVSNGTLIGVRDAALVEYELHGEGRLVCPVCLGGSGGEKCMTVYQGGDGSVLATCHRANCPVQTVVVCRGRAMPCTVPPEDNSKLYEGTLPKATAISRDTFQRRIADRYRFEYSYSAISPYIEENDDALVFPMLSFDGSRMGDVVRPYTGRTKALTYKYNKTYHGMSWYRDTRGLSIPQVFILEDSLSAMAMQAMRGCAVSLNGTNINEARINELLQYKWQLILMLDADATRQAIRYAQMYGPDLIRVLRLSQDIKDSTQAEVAQVLYREGL